MTLGSPWPAQSGGCILWWMLRQAAAACARSTADGAGSARGSEPELWRALGPSPALP